MVVKGLAKAVAKSYDDHSNMNLSPLVLTDTNGKSSTLSSLFAGKTVYMYIWKQPQNLPPGEDNMDYRNLKKRFAKYSDVVFINVYTGSTEQDWKQILKLKNPEVSAYHLSSVPVNNAFSTLMQNSTSPQILGKDGKLLGFKGPKPTDKIVVDYALYQARNGTDATTATKTLIKGIDSKSQFKNKKLADWYETHYGQKPSEKLNISISNSENNSSN
ncbi:hypothetical protein H7F33_17950 [Pedobacter sp. PAMC26386]|nr:hypothetical protein H7F33_17950 [Pedobacter sp. PAMC26386]